MRRAFPAALLGAALCLLATTGPGDSRQGGPLSVLSVGPDLPGFSLAESALMATSCGVERWSVKTASDADKLKINLSDVVRVSVDTLRAKAKPGTLPANVRIKPVEVTSFLTAGTVLKQYKVESDGDIHLVLRNSAGRTVVAELPNPTCVSSGSRLRSSIVGARQQFLRSFAPTTSWKYPNRAVRVKAIGYFDYLHGQTGMAPNGIELHPVIGFYVP
jgi:hypothetical protein